MNGHPNHRTPTSHWLLPSHRNHHHSSIKTKERNINTYKHGEGRRVRMVEGLHMTLLLFYALLLQLVPLTSSSGAPSYGCYWTEECQSKWFGGCSKGHIIVNQSVECHGLCSESVYPPCLPFHTHFYCCIPERPRAVEKCSKCPNKVDFGEEYVCCTDCSDPHILDIKIKLGYCESAQLAMQLKPQETFKWIAGPWMKCSLPCDGGVRYRDVGCFGSTEDNSISHYPVDDSKCSADEMPSQQEACNVKSCVDNVSIESSTEQSSATGWSTTLLVLLGLIATGGLAYAGYDYHKRRTSSSHGFVYIMLEGYS